MTSSKERTRYAISGIWFVICLFCCFRCAQFTALGSRARAHKAPFGAHILYRQALQRHRQGKLHVKWLILLTCRIFSVVRNVPSGTNWRQVKCVRTTVVPVNFCFRRTRQIFAVPPRFGTALANGRAGIEPFCCVPRIFTFAVQGRLR